MPWISFCISTFKRPQFLLTQLDYISKQSFKDFEVVISDNDPECSAKDIVAKFDSRFRYYSNDGNIGMINSFNKSIERSTGDYILMITDDDFFTDEKKLQSFFEINQHYPNQPIYINCIRKNKSIGQIEVSDGENFVYELLNPEITEVFLWSDCILNSKVVKSIGGIPDYGSPHLADHALLALCGKDGGVFINNIASEINVHELNYSKKNLDTYYIGCAGFYTLINKEFSNSQLNKDINALDMHLKNWIIKCILSLRSYYLKNKMKEDLKQLNLLSKKILALDFMKKHLSDFKSAYFSFNIQNLKKYLSYYLLG